MLTMNVKTDVNVTTHDTEQSFPAVTRAQAKAGVQPLPDFDSSLLQVGTKGPRKTSRQQRLIKYMGTPVPKPSTEGLEVNDWQVTENISELKQEDETVKPLQKLFVQVILMWVMSSMFCKMMCCICKRVMF